MQPTFSEMKSAARTALRHRWPEAVAVSMICFSTVLLNGIVRAILTDVFKLDSVWSPLALNGLTVDRAAASIGVAAFSVILSLCLSFPLFFGALRWFWQVTAGSNPSVGEIFYYFSSPKRFFKTVALSVVTYIIIMLAAVVCMLPSAVMSELTSPDFYNEIGLQMPVLMEALRSLVVVLHVIGLLLLCFFAAGPLLSFTVVFSEPELSVFGTLSCTMKLAKGLRFNFTVFVFSFFGWALASILILPLIFSIPYFLSSLTVYGREAERAFKRRAECDSRLYGTSL